MQIRNIRSLIEGIFREEPGLPSVLDGIEFVSRRHTTVYRARAGQSTFIIHVTPNTSEDLTRIHDNLRTLEPLADDRIPRVLAFRRAGQNAPLDDRYAVLVMTNIPGDELSPRSFNQPAWSSLCDVLARVHGLRVHGMYGHRSGPRVDEPASFPDFAATFRLHIEQLPLGLERVRGHLDAMNEYLAGHRSSFAIPRRLIHGDISRDNIRLAGGRAGVIDWADLSLGDYAYDLAMLKLALDSVVPKRSADLVRELARDYRRNFEDDTLEVRLRFFFALPGLVSAYWYTNEKDVFPAARAWRVRTCYLHSEAQWRSPLRLDDKNAGAPVIRTEHWPLRIPQPARGLFYLLAPKRVG
jgi:aminoglycoside phosphotransferase (APT) family kinase protein